LTDFIEVYKHRVRDLLWPSETKGPSAWADALCFPSFHAETLLRVTEEEGETKCSLTTFGSSLWYSGDSPEPLPLLNESTYVPAELARDFWQLIGNLAPESIKPEDMLGMDGISISASYQRGQVTAAIETWSPGPSSAPGQFVGAIYRLAWEVLSERFSIERLEQLHCYLGLGLPIRLIGGTPTCLRIFGRLSILEQDSLRDLFGSLHGTEPLVIDMTNFEGMGTMLYPHFVAFGSRPRPLAWAATGRARQQIEAIGLHQPMIFDNVQDATDWLSGQ
jgi:hypothetical protein